MGKFIFWALVVIVALSWLGSRGGSNSGGTTSSSSSSTKTAPDVTDITVAAEGLVRDHLKAPSTAKFPGYPEVRWDSANRRASAIGKVDAQNAFGAMLRQQYVVIMQLTCSTDFYRRSCWQIEGLTIGDQWIIDRRQTAKSQQPKRTAAPPIKLSKAEIQELQRALVTKGYAAGEADGAWGPVTAKAVEEFRRANNLPVNNVVDSKLLEALQGR